MMSLALLKAYLFLSDMLNIWKEDQIVGSVYVSNINVFQLHYVISIQTDLTGRGLDVGRPL